MSAQRANRPQRTPLGRRSRLTAEKRPGYVRRWVNDVEDRLERFRAAGYDFVSSQDPSEDGKESRRIKNVGGGAKAYLMEIDEKFYREDQATKQQDVDAREAGLRPNTNDGQHGGVKIKQTRAGGAVRTTTIGDDPGA